MTDDAIAGTELPSLLKPYQASVQEIVGEARRIILAILPGATEVVDSKARLVGYGYGTGYRDIICTLILSKGGVKLGVVGGASLPDPHHLMEGMGKVHRHVPLRTSEDLRRAGMKPLLQAALSAWRQRTSGGA
jgi:hypothetical protein